MTCVRKFAVPRVCLDRRLDFVVIVPMNVRYWSKADKSGIWRDRYATQFIRSITSAGTCEKPSVSDA
jgi:hypothetical protein